MTSIHMEKKSKSKSFIFAVGRRKTAIARVRLFKGKGETLVNDQPIAKYFFGKVAQKLWEQPFEVTEILGNYYATIRIIGSGKNSQLGAAIHGLARALDKAEKTYHSPLKLQKLLTRDPRARERRKVGQMGKARKQKQSPKR